MMKKVMCVILAALTLMLCCGCGRKDGEGFTKSGRFVIVRGNDTTAPYEELIIADRDTGVLYLVVHMTHRLGITPLLDADGKPLLLEEKS